LKQGGFPPTGWKFTNESGKEISRKELFCRNDRLNAVKNKVIGLQKGSQVQWLSLNTAYVDNTRGNENDALVISFLDITGQKKISAEMKILSMVAKETLNAVFILRLTGELLWTNEGFTRLTGYTREELATTRDALHGPDTNTAVIEEMRSAREKGIPFKGEQTIYTKAGKKIYTKVEGQPLKDEDGNVTGLFVIMTDTTEEKRLIQEMEVLSLVARETSNGVMIFDIQTGSILWVNDGFTRLTGFGSDDILGKNPVAVLQGAGTSQEMLNYMSSRIQKGLPYSGDLLIYTKNGDTRLHHVTAQPFKDLTGRVTKYFAIATDITDRQQMEKERLQKEIEQQKEITRVTLESQENARNELGRELHDNINQILAAVNMQVAYCLSHYEKGRPALETVHENVKEAMYEIRRLSHTMVMPRFREDSLNEKLNKLLVNYSNGQVIKLDTRGWTEKNIPISVKETFFRVAQEQLNNIHKYAQAKEVVVHIENSANNASMSIEDNGVGFDTEKERAGIGLSNIISRVELYNGTTKIISSPGKGCVLSINIPLPTG
jgi:PAS domain S-box-containing protein